MVKPGSVRLGPVEWGVVVAHRPYGLEVRLEASGDVGVVDRILVDDNSFHANEEYWPDVGDRVRVRRMDARPSGELRLTAQQGVVNGWTEPREVVRRRVYEWPAGLGETEHGVVTAVHELGFDVRLDASPPQSLPAHTPGPRQKTLGRGAASRLPAQEGRPGQDHHPQTTPQPDRHTKQDTPTHKHTKPLDQTAHR